MDPVMWQQYSKEHTDRIHRLMPLLMIDDLTRRYPSIADEMEWGPRTQDTYWQSLLTAKKILGITVTLADTALSKVLRKKAETAPDWDLEQPGVVLTQQQLDLLFTLAHAAPAGAPIQAALLTYCWGQRYHDVCRLHNFPRNKDLREEGTLHPSRGIEPPSGTDALERSDSGKGLCLHRGCQERVRNARQDRHQSLAEDRLDSYDNDRDASCNSPHILETQHPQDARGLSPTRHLQPCGGHRANGSHGASDNLHLANGGQRDKRDLLLTAMVGTHSIKTHSAPDFTLPLHIKAVGRVTWADLIQYVSAERRDQFLNLSRIFNDRDFLDTIAIDSLLKFDSDAAISEEDHHRLLLANLSEPIASSEVRGTCRVFTNNESEKHRRRLIAEPALNDILPEKGEVDYATPEDVRSGLMYEYATLTDYPWYYGQWPIAPQCRAYYTYRFRGHHYALTTVTTGARQLPAIAHSVTKGIVMRALSVHTETPAQGDAYLDNVRFCSDRSTAERLLKTFLEISIQAGITVDPPTPPTGTYDFLGAACQHAREGLHASITITEKTRRKIHNIQFTQSMTLRQYLSAMGVFVWASRVVGLPLAGCVVIGKICN